MIFYLLFLRLFLIKRERTIVASVEFTVHTCGLHNCQVIVQILWIFQQVLLLSYSPVIVWSRFGSYNFSSRSYRRAPSSADRRKQFHQQQRRWWGSLSHLTPSTLVRCSPAFQQLILNRFAFSNAIKFILVADFHRRSVQLLCIQSTLGFATSLCQGG